MTMIRSITTLTSALALGAGLFAAPSKTDVNGLLQSYYAVHHGLASDDLAATRSAATSLGEKAGAIGAPAGLASAAAAVAEAADIKAARAEFQQLSSRMQALVEATGTEGPPVYVIHCPMAFGGKGADWLQDEETIANPYFGSMMPSCGTVIKEVGGSSSAR